MALKYIITNIQLGQALKTEDNQYIYNPTIIIGIEGDIHGMYLSDGCTVEITNVSGTPSEIETYILQECNNYVSQKYNPEI